MAADAKKKQIQTAEEKKPSGQRKAASAKRTQQAAEKKSGERKNTAKKETSAKPASGRADAKKRAASKRTSDKPVNIKLTEKELLDFPIMDEVLIWASLAVCVILMFSMFGFGGKIGTAIGEFFFGIFGFMAYLAPFLLFFLIAFLISNEGSLLAWIKGASMVLLYMCLCGFTELLSNRYLSSRKLVDYYTDSVNYKNGGGLTGGFLGSILCPAVGVAGAYVVLVILMIICVIMITERSLLNGVKRGGRKVVKTAMDDASVRMERAELRRERQRVRREQLRQEERRKLEQERKQLEELRREQTGGPKVVTDFLLTRPSEDHSGNLKEVVAPVPEHKTEGPRYVFGKQEVKQEKPEIPSARPSFQPEPLNLEPVEAEDLDVHLGLTEEPKKEEPAMEDDFPIQRGEIHPTLDGGFGSELLRMGKEQERSMQENREELPYEDIPVSEDLKESERPVVEEVREKHLDFFERQEMDVLEVQEKAAAVPAENTKTAENAGMTEHMAKNPRSSREEQEKSIAEVVAEIEEQEADAKPVYEFPPLDLLKSPSRTRTGDSDETLRSTARKLQQTLHNFGVEVTVSNVSCGPSVTRYELTPEQGVRVSKIVNLADDIKLNLAAADIRIEAPIPGKMAVGIEVPNKENSAVPLRELLESREFQEHPSNLAFAVGKDIAGKVVVTDIAKMPHLLIAGATGSGKSVCINTIIMSLLYKASPEDVKIIMIDPKVVELSVYNGIPHLFIPVVTDPKKAAGALNWAVAEMTDRYNKFAEVNVRDLKGYNAKIEALDGVEGIDEKEKPKKLPQIVIIVDELADLMMVAPGEVEDAICRLAQLARAAGLHLIIATQRPSVNVITGLIKANMPSRIAFSVSSGVDSRTIIDMNGAEKLLGKGDMLFYPQGYQKPARVQGAFVSDDEVGKVVDFLAGQVPVISYSKDIEAQISKAASSADSGGEASEVDALFKEAGKFIIEKDKASIGMLQRMFKIGFNRAARIMDQLSDAGVVGPEEGTKPRKILMSMEEFENYIEESI